MTRKTNDIVVYHASYVTIENIDLKFSKPNKDFGTGFYVTTDYNQAKKFALLISKKMGINTAYINHYRLSNLTNLDVHEFKTTDAEWLKCVSNFRNIVQISDIERYKKKDVIIGKVADDNTNLVINTYIRGGYGQLNNPKVMEAVIGLLMADKLTDQICFKTKRSLKKLMFIKSEVIEYVKK